MSGKWKGWINKGGLIAIVISVVVYIATGGNAEAAGSIVTITAGITGAALILLREILG